MFIFIIKSGESYQIDNFYLSVRRQLGGQIAATDNFVSMIM